MLGSRQEKPLARSPTAGSRTGRQLKPERYAQPNRGARNQRSNLWYAFYFPALTTRPDDEETGPSMLPLVAQHCLQISDCISLDGEDALVLEVGRSLRYFGSLARIRMRIEPGIRARLPHSVFFQAITPSASASLLLARTGHESAISRAEDLRSRLGNIPTSALAVDIRTRKKLAKCGLFYLRDIWRLPLPELRIRFGRHFSEYLEQCLALRPESRALWQPKPEYHDHYEVDQGLHSQQQVLTVCDQLLHRLEAFLRQHHLCTEQLLLCLEYATGSQCEEITVNVRKADRTARLFLLLLETQLSGMIFAGEIYTVSLHVTNFTDFKPEGGVRHQNQDSCHGFRLLDQLAARLGSHSVQRLFLQQDYCPEFATRMVPYLTPPEDNITDTWRPELSDNQHPCWLLEPPRLLPIRNHQLYYLSPLTLLRGPRRIETRWWEEKGIRRDYYVAANAQGNVLWVYQDLTCRTQTRAPQTSWYLHGFFG